MISQVSVKARAAAVADTYANQGARAGSILPFTSALAGLCAAASAAAVEILPLINNLSLESFIAMFFPGGAALFAAAASVSKARCEVDAAAASQAASTGLVGRDDNPKDPVTVVIELIRLTVKASWQKIRLKVKRAKKIAASSLAKFLSLFFPPPDSSLEVVTYPAPLLNGTMNMSMANVTISPASQ
jgi:hypothetical protein